MLFQAGSSSKDILEACQHLNLLAANMTSSTVPGNGRENNSALNRIHKLLGTPMQYADVERSLGQS